jgi:uncharacterized protein YodC (DUF2158 family)
LEGVLKMKEETRKILSIGDVANLRSGGPAMTVVGFEKDDSTPVHAPDLSPRGFGGLVRCVWFDESARLQAHAFPHGLLDMKSEAPKDEPTHAAADKRLDASADVERRNAEVRRLTAEKAAQAQGQAQQPYPVQRQQLNENRDGNPNAAS